MTRLLKLAAACGLLFSSVGCCCLSGGGYGACYPPASPCPGGACGIGAVPGPGVAQATISPNAVTTATSGPVAIGPIVPGQVTYHVPMTTTTYVTPLTTTATLQPLPTY